MTVAEATPALDDVVDRHDRAFLGHPKGFGYLGAVEFCERAQKAHPVPIGFRYILKYIQCIDCHIDTGAQIFRIGDCARSVPYPDRRLDRWQRLDDVKDRNKI